MSAGDIVGRVVFDVVESSDECDGCALDNGVICHFKHPCSSVTRPDGKSVIFKAHPETPVPPPGRNDCPQCGAGMLLIATQNKKICVDCCVEYPWELEKGQKSLVRAQR